MLLTSQIGYFSGYPADVCKLSMKPWNSGVIFFKYTHMCVYVYTHLPITGIQYN